MMATRRILYLSLLCVLCFCFANCHRPEGAKNDHDSDKHDPPPKSPVDDKDENHDHKIPLKNDEAEHDRKHEDDDDEVDDDDDDDTKRYKHGKPNRKQKKRDNRKADDVERVEKEYDDKEDSPHKNGHPHKNHRGNTDKDHSEEATDENTNPQKIDTFDMFSDTGNTVQESSSGDESKTTQEQGKRQSPQNVRKKEKKPMKQRKKNKKGEREQFQDGQKVWKMRHRQDKN